MAGGRPSQMALPSSFSSGTSGTRRWSPPQYSKMEKMNSQIVMRMSTTQIHTALDCIERELAALLADQCVLQAGRDRRMSARQPRHRPSAEDADENQGGTVSKRSTGI